MFADRGVRVHRREWLEVIAAPAAQLEACGVQLRDLRHPAIISHRVGILGA